jgi:hypothetical protein
VQKAKCLKGLFVDLTNSLLAGVVLEAELINLQDLLTITNLILLYQKMCEQKHN